LTGSIARMMRGSSMCSGSGSWTSSPSIASSPFSRVTSSCSSSSVVCEARRMSRVRRGVVSDEHRRQAELSQPANLFGELAANALGECLTVH
jgi:hypothetical protein